jgi:hypothetical protein
MTPTIHSLKDVSRHLAHHSAEGFWLSRTLSETVPFESLVLSQRRGKREHFMTRTSKKPGELRSEYKRSDFGVLVRGKYVQQLQKTSNVLMLDLEIADLFPNAASVNAALRALAEIARRSRSTPRKSP